MRKSSDETLVAAMYILAQDIQTQDGIANAAVREAGDRIAELRQQRDELLEFAEFFIRTEGKAHPDSPTGKRLMIKAKQAIERGKP